MLPFWVVTHKSNQRLVDDIIKLYEKLTNARILPHVDSVLMLQASFETVFEWGFQREPIKIFWDTSSGRSSELTVPWMLSDHLLYWPHRTPWSSIITPPQKEKVLIEQSDSLKGQVCWWLTVCMCLLLSRIQIEDRNFECPLSPYQPQSNDGRARTY